MPGLANETGERLAAPAVLAQRLRVNIEIGADLFLRITGDRESRHLAALLIGRLPWRAAAGIRILLRDAFGRGRALWL
jgi:hypothetical protein